MVFTLGDVVALMLLGLLCGWFLASIRVRELAVAAVARAGKRDDFQLLDQNVHLNRISLSRDEQRRWRVWRQYRFDYSFDGVERHEGYVIMLGQRLQAVIVREPETTLH
ncbi:MAG: DUF3301 domain-containing protein [Halieaceae bacterium]|jgi:hypothetical protein|uniref:DUF3301 domain-containing protein n=1 Tax=Haliea TaxID=475794 RepID=UPI00041076D1|nr:MULTISPECIES: DUF3301 domain-containing protein [Haliea]MCR9184470.1 DUF3301 domain-containing protein [Halieaceae bacterium]